jgi:hypothetical protein
MNYQHSNKLLVIFCHAGPEPVSSLVFRIFALVPANNLKVTRETVSQLTFLLFRASEARHGEVPFRVNPVFSVSSGCRLSPA